MNKTVYPSQPTNKPKTFLMVAKLVCDGRHGQQLSLASVKNFFGNGRLIEIARNNE